MEMEIGNRILRQVRLSALEAEVAHFARLHDDWFGGDLHEVEGSGREGLQERDSGCDAGLQLGEGGFVVFERLVGLLEDAHDVPFCGVGEGLDLVGDSGVVSFVYRRGSGRE